jgi:uroporphyrinogen-III synthase
MKLLVIRPGPGADATATRVEAAGLEALVMPLFGIEPVAWDAPPATDFDAILLTSANAVREAGVELSSLKELPVLAVGAVTAVAAQRAGLQVSHTGNAGADALLSGLKDSRLLWLAGEDHSDIIVSASVLVTMRIVYRSAALPVPDGFSETVMRADHVLLHSPRAARHFAALIAGQGLDRTDISIAALSDNIARAAGAGWKTVYVAAEPNDAALLSCLPSRITDDQSDPYVTREKGI